MRTFCVYLSTRFRIRMFGKAVPYLGLSMTMSSDHRERDVTHTSVTSAHVRTCISLFLTQTNVTDSRHNHAHLHTSDPERHVDELYDTMTVFSDTVTQSIYRELIIRSS